MRVIRSIALNVFKESVRDKVLYNLVFFAVMLIAVSYLLGELTAGQDVKIIKDLGLAAMSVFGLFIAVFIGIGLVSKEVERRSIYSLLAKPISRQQFIVGKYLGLVLTLLVNVTVMTIAYYAVLGIMAWTAGSWTNARRRSSTSSASPSTRARGCRGWESRSSRWSKSPRRSPRRRCRFW